MWETYLFSRMTSFALWFLFCCGVGLSLFTLWKRLASEHKSFKLCLNISPAEVVFLCLTVLSNGAKGCGRKVRQFLWVINSSVFTNLLDGLRSLLLLFFCGVLSVFPWERISDFKVDLFCFFQISYLTHTNSYKVHIKHTKF